MWKPYTEYYRHLYFFYGTKRKRIALGSFVIFFVFLLFYGTLYRAPSEFIAGQIIRVEEGETLTEISQKLEMENIVRSSFWLRNIVFLFGGERTVVEGDYFFPRKKTLGGVARVLIQGEHGLVPIRVTIPEGSSAIQIADILAKKLSKFDSEEFLRLVRRKEGYLFPDTYFFLPNVDERKIAAVLEDTFVEKIATLEESIKSSEHDFAEVLVMASIVEREAYTHESRRIIAGILWKRLELGIPLQVDVTFDVINGKNSFELTLEDLEIDSPFNTYKYAGLPPAPIANPGLGAITATLEPTESDYLYFLADLEGNIYYSQNFEEHKRKKILYLN